MIHLLRPILLILCFVFSSGLVLAQTVVEHTAWASIFNTTKINDRWGLQYDMHFRLANDYKYLRNLLIRPAVIYNINKTNHVGLGYVLYDTFGQTSATPTLTEHRIYEQYTHLQSAKAVAITHRFRIEQRFIERAAPTNVFSQRFRYFVRAVIPLAKQKAAFTKGMYTAVQDELFVNLQNKNEINGSMFDQNRIAATIGYRFSKQLDIEAGYHNQFVKRSANNLSNNIAQLTFYTRF